MAETKINVNTSGPGFLLFLVFLALKLTGEIDWSWWWVTAPLWGGIAFLLILLLIALGIAGLLDLWG
jgi:hypothetical protein